MTLRIASWNVNSLNVRLPQVKKWLVDVSPDILALQETKLPDERFPEDELFDLGYHVIYSGQKTYNGVAIIYKSDLKVDNVLTSIPEYPDNQKRFISAEINGIKILNLYVVNGQSVGSEKFLYKLEWLDKIKNYIKNEIKNYKYYIVVGDFNIAPDNRDVYDPVAWQGKILCSEPERHALNEIQSLGFKDTFRLFDQPEKSYSWWDYRAASFRRNMGLRIDLMLVNSGMEILCNSAWIDKEPRKWERPSDHAPVISEFDNISISGN